jgi:hypothetical protein
MSRRPDFTPDRPLSVEQLTGLRERLSRMSMTSLEDFYHAAWLRCQRDRKGALPKAESIQELVQAWRELRKSGQR